MSTQWPLLNRARNYGISDKMVSFISYDNENVPKLLRDPEIRGKFLPYERQWVRYALSPVGPPQELFPVHFGYWPEIDFETVPDINNDLHVPFGWPRHIWAEYSFTTGQERYGAIEAEEFEHPVLGRVISANFYWQAELGIVKKPLHTHVAFHIMVDRKDIYVHDRWADYIVPELPPKPDPVFEAIMSDGVDVNHTSTQSQCVVQLAIFLKLLSCSNVELVETHPSTRRENAKKDPTRVVYRELKINPPPFRQKRYQNNDDHGEGVAFHVRRGHFADYTQGNGLFGKYKIRVWVPGHTVGDQDFGTVLKSYVVGDVDEP